MLAVIDPTIKPEISTDHILTIPRNLRTRKAGRAINVTTMKENPIPTSNKIAKE